MIVLDTDALIDLTQRTTTRRKAHLVALLSRIVHPTQPIATTCFNLAELRVGIELSKQNLTQRERELARLATVQDSMLVLWFDDACVSIYALVEAALRRKGLPIGVMDTLISAVALRHNAQLVTANATHFRHVPGLQVHVYQSE